MAVESSLIPHYLLHLFMLIDKKQITHSLFLFLEYAWFRTKEGEWQRHKNF